MSWDIFKSMMQPYMENPNGVKSKEDFAKKFTDAYDMTMKMGTVLIKGNGGSPLPLKSGNKEIMEKLMVAACAMALTKSDTGKHTFLKDVGNAVVAYWSTGILQSVPPSVPATGAVQNISLTQGQVMNPGKWPETPPEFPTDDVGNFLDTFTLYANIHLLSIEFLCQTTSIYPGFPISPILPGTLQTKGYQLN